MKTSLTALITTVALSTALLGHSGHHHHNTGDLAPHQIVVDGNDEATLKIQRLQSRLAKDPLNPALLENLGWLFVAKARAASDHSYYAHAIQCAQALTEQPNGKQQGILMLGHLYLQEHRFEEAAKVARQLVKERGWHYDYGLLGDVLFDQGDMKGAIAAYEAMMLQRPGLESFARAALIRWQRGQLDSAIEAMELAVSAGSLRNPEPLAWAYSKLAGFYLQKAAYSQVERLCGESLRLVPNYPHAQLILGRSFMAQGKFSAASPLLTAAAQTLPEPAFLWALRDCHQMLEQQPQAKAVENRLLQSGPQTDPRTYALFVATVGGNAKEAVELTTHELTQRQDIFTYDAVAWAQHAEGNVHRAASAMEKALIESTADARLHLHAAIIFSKSGKLTAASEHLSEADRYKALLLPSELRLLEEARETLGAKS